MYGNHTVNNISIIVWKVHNSIIGSIKRFNDKHCMDEKECVHGSAYVKIMNI